MKEILNTAIHNSIGSHSKSFLIRRTAANLGAVLQNNHVKKHFFCRLSDPYCEGTTAFVREACQTCFPSRAGVHFNRFSILPVRGCTRRETRKRDAISVKAHPRPPINITFIKLLTASLRFCHDGIRFISSVRRFV